MTTTSRAETVTIHEMLAAAPDVDVRETWEAFWSILSDAKDRVTRQLPVEPHPSTADHAYYRGEDGAFEGSLTTYTGPGVDWLVHSWIGNRQRSILDMNLTVWLGQEVDVPHLIIVLGTVPLAYHYSDLLPRRDLAVETDYLRRYYDPENADWLAFRGDDRFTWSVSHGTYMRAIISPVTHSYTAERSPAIVDALREHVNRRVDRWLEAVRSADPVPEAERPALRRRDHTLRRNAYRLDPMNALAAKFLGAGTVERLVGLRSGDALLEVD